MREIWVLLCCGSLLGCAARLHSPQAERIPSLASYQELSAAQKIEVLETAKVDARLEDVPHLIKILKEETTPGWRTSAAIALGNIQSAQKEKMLLDEREHINVEDMARALRNAHTPEARDFLVDLTVKLDPTTGIQIFDDLLADDQRHAKRAFLNILSKPLYRHQYDLLLRKAQKAPFFSVWMWDQKRNPASKLSETLRDVRFLTSPPAPKL